MVTLGKSISAGFMPISILLADSEIMDLIKPNQHGSTFGGSPLASALAKASLEALDSEGMVENSARMGELFRTEINKITGGYLKGVRGKGLMNAIILDNTTGPSNSDFSIELARNGLLTKASKTDLIRMMPPLIITEEEIHLCVEIISKVLKSF
jgi:ornithine--oxo-acid transaminase